MRLRCSSSRCRRCLPAIAPSWSGWRVASCSSPHMSAFGYLRLDAPDAAAHQSLPVRIVQPSIDQSMKLDRTSRDEIFRTLLNLSAAPLPADGPQPEADHLAGDLAAVPAHRSARRAGGDRRTACPTARSCSPAMSAPRARATEAQRYYNSVVAINDRGEIIDAVDKLHLVPGGEYLPLAELFAAASASTASSPCRRRFRRERSAIRSRLAGGLKAAIFVCYEIIFPDEVSRGHRKVRTSSSTSPTTPGSATRPAPTSISATPRFALPRRACRSRARPTTASRARSIRAGRIIDAFALNVRGTLDVDARHSDAFVAAFRRSDPQRICSRRPSCSWLPQACVSFNG